MGPNRVEQNISNFFKELGVGCLQWGVVFILLALAGAVFLTYFTIKYFAE